MSGAAGIDGKLGFKVNEGSTLYGKLGLARQDLGSNESDRPRWYIYGI